MIEQVMNVQTQGELSYLVFRSQIDYEARCHLLMIDEVIETPQKVQNEEEVSFILFAMMVAARNYISEKQMEKIKEVLTMTTVGKMFEDEKRTVCKGLCNKGQS